jgi:hypothetical protein
MVVHNVTKGNINFKTEFNWYLSDSERPKAIWYRYKHRWYRYAVRVRLASLWFVTLEREVIERASKTLNPCLKSCMISVLKKKLPALRRSNWCLVAWRTRCEVSHNTACSYGPLGVHYTNSQTWSKAFVICSCSKLREIFVQLQSEGITGNFSGENCVDKMRKLLYRINW